MDPVIQDITQQVLDWRNYQFTAHQLRRWAEYLRDVVQPQLDELEALKASPPAQKRKVG